MVRGNKLEAPIACDEERSRKQRYGISDVSILFKLPFRDSGPPVPSVRGPASNMRSKYQACQWGRIHTENSLRGFLRIWRMQRCGSVCPLSAAGFGRSRADVRATFLRMLKISGFGRIASAPRGELEESAVGLDKAPRRTPVRQCRRGLNGCKFKVTNGQEQQNYQR